MMPFRRCTLSLAIAPVLVILTGLNGISLPLIHSVTLAQEVIAENKETEAEQLVEEARQQAIAGQVELALETLQTALILYQDSGDRQGIASSYRLQGINYYVLGRYKQSLDSYNQALSIFRELDNSQGQAVTLESLGMGLFYLGQTDQSIEILNVVVAIYKCLDYRPCESAIFSNLGNIHDAMEQYDQAITFHQQALDVAQQIDDPYFQRIGQIQPLLGLGVIYSDLGNYQDAIEVYEAVLLIQRQPDINDVTGEADSLNALGRAYTGLKEYQQALDYYQQALSIATKTGYRSQEAQTFSEIGMLFSQQQQPEIAIVFYKQAVNIQEAIRQNMHELPLEIRQSYAESIADIYRELADLLLQQDRVLEAQQVLDLLKIQELDDYLHNVRGSAETAEGVEYLLPEQKLLELYDHAIAQGQELVQLRTISASDRTPVQRQRLAELVANQQNLVSSFDEFLSRPDVIEAVDQLSHTARRQNLDLAHLNALQDNLRQLDNAVLLYPLILDDRLELVLVTPYSPPIRRTVAVDREEVNRAVAQFRTHLASHRSGRSGNVLTEAQQLYQWLIQPIEDDLKQANAETILYAPDAQLRYIPLAALHDGDQWLIQQYRVNHITAASLTDFDTPSVGAVKVLAGAFSQGKASFQVGTRQFSLRGLPFAGVEINTIAAAIPETTTLFNQAFSPEATIPHMDDHTIVHLATHAEFVTGLPHESFILFGNGDRITLRDLSTWSLPNVDLVVLSACQTAVGGALGNGEEILGFGYQIQRTGAKAALASLWSVSDGGTQVLMNAFYAGLEQGMTKAEALRQAQIALITGDLSGAEGVSLSLQNTPDTTELSESVKDHLDQPYYWAPFILIGNGL